MEIWLAKISIDIRRQPTTIWLWIDWVQHLRRCLIQPAGQWSNQLSHGPASVHRLTEPFALSQQMISKHIACLVRARIVLKTKRGRESVCTLRPEAIKTVSQWAFSYRRFWEESFDKLEVVVKQMKKAEVGHDKT
jgi:DNA-binding transcriptional ArsR family regulator